MDDKAKYIKTLENLLQTMTDAEARAVACYVPIMKENEKYKWENAVLRERNSELESVLANVKDAAEAVVSSIILHK